MKPSLIAVAMLVLVAGACKSKSTASRDAPAAAVAAAKLTDLSGSLDAVRTEFNAHRGEARFLALLAPT
jgi:hypothetical protein